MYLQGMTKPPGRKIVGTRRSAGPCKEGGGGGSRSMQQGGPVHAMPLCCHSFLEALKVDWPKCNLHSIKSGETRVCKNVSSINKSRCRDGAVCTCKVWQNHLAEKS